MKPTVFVLSCVLAFAAFACRVAPPPPPVTAAPAPPTVAAASPTVPAALPSPSAAAASSPPAGTPAIPNAPVVGQRAPGTFTPNGVITVKNGGASINATDSLKWQPNIILAKPGEQVSLSIQNTGSTVHNIISASLGIPLTDIPVQQTISVAFTAPDAPGAYQFWCMIPGHPEAGMVGEVIVQ